MEIKKFENFDKINEGKENTREDGFYWVKLFDKEWTIGEFTGNELDPWQIIGDNHRYVEGHVGTSDSVFERIGEQIIY